MSEVPKVPPDIAKGLEKCKLLHVTPGPPSDFHSREKSDRFVQGTNPTLITVRVVINIQSCRVPTVTSFNQNASIWTGGKDGTEVVLGDILLDRGMIKQTGNISRDTLAQSGIGAYEHVDAQGKWVSPG